MIKEILALNKPAYVGLCILDLYMTLMYDFQYNCIKPKYGNKAKLLLTDTDSWTYEIEAEDVYQDFWEIKINLIIVTIQKTLHVWRDKQKDWRKIQR